MRLKSYRRTSQFVFTLLTVSGLLGVGTLGFVYPYFFCYACPFDVAACPIGMMEHGAADMVNYGVLAGLTVIGYSLGFLLLMASLFGRGFCGWGCPVGLVQDVTRKTGVHRTARKACAPGGMDRRLRWAKYGFLVAIPFLSWYFLDLVYTRFCPIGGVTGTLPALTFYPGDWATSTWFSIKVISIASFFALVVFVGRGWCKYLCPVGAALAPGNKVTPLRLVRDEKRCIDCGLCERNCPMTLEDIGRKTDPECILCGRCTESCQHGCLKLKYAPGGRGTKITAALLVMVVVSGALFAYGYAGVGYERTNDVNDFPCLGCLALDPAGSSEFAPFAGTVPAFVATPLDYNPVFIHYRTDVCSACDEMEPTIASLESEFGGRIDFIHINLDHCDEPQFDSYDLFDVKGTPDARTGVPMFVSCARALGEGGAAQLQFSTSYGVMARQKLADSMNETLEMHVPAGSGPAPSDSKAIVELFVDTTCTYCPYSEDALVSMKAAGSVNFVTYVTDAPGETGVYAKYREEALQALTSAGGAHPWAVFAGGQVENLKGTPTIGAEYAVNLTQVRFSDVPVSIEGNLTDAGSAMDIAVSVTNAGAAASSIDVQGYLVERTSRWPNIRDEPIPYAFVDLVVNATSSVPAGASATQALAWSGTDALPYSSFTPSNLALVVAVYADGVLATSTIIESDVVDGVSFVAPLTETAALPNGTASVSVELRNSRASPAAVELEVDAPAGGTATVHPATLAIAGDGSAKATVTMTGSNTTVGDAAEIRIVVKGAIDPTLFASGLVAVEVKADVLAPSIVLRPLGDIVLEGTENVTIRAAVGDDTDLSSVKISWYSCTDTTCSAIVTKEMELDGNEYAAVISALREGDIVVHYRIIAEDLDGNVNGTEMLDIDVEPLGTVETVEGSVPQPELGLLVMACALVAAFCLIAAGRRK